MGRKSGNLQSPDSCAYYVSETPIEADDLRAFLAILNRRLSVRPQYSSDQKVYGYLKGIAAYVDTMSFYADFFVNMKHASCRG